MTVLDFGGACGAHYFRMRTLFPSHLRLRWHVVETPAMSRKAAPLHNQELAFFESIAEAQKSLGRIDIVLSSGTLQCVPDPHRSLMELLACRASYLVLPRLGLSETESDIITIHDARLSDNDPGPLPAGIADGMTRYPFTFPARSAIEAAVMKDYEIILKAHDSTEVFPVNHEPLVGFGYIGRKQALRESL
ncbi:MAG: methyltransferase, TIGR04325 family [Verrucomicrobia bacterium]|nr:methyltransferase, TIGR04325 family [Verrucomicrobiota bacterium]